MVPLPLHHRRLVEPLALKRRRKMNLMKSAAFMSILVFSLVTGLCLAQPSFVLAEPFNYQDVRFDESMGDKMPTPTIPKGWRFVGVSNGEKMNSNNLWFQDSNGNIYLLQGFTSYGKFILKQTVQKINTGK